MAFRVSYKGITKHQGGLESVLSSLPNIGDRRRRLSKSGSKSSRFSEAFRQVVTNAT